MNKREEVLNEALQAVTKDRNQDYGPPERNFQNIADLWLTRLIIRLRELGWEIRSMTGQVSDAEIRDRLLKAHDTAIWLQDVKTCRIEQSPQKKDHWVDIAGYAACAYDSVKSQ